MSIFQKIVQVKMAGTVFVRLAETRKIEPGQK
jgi:hypothetical protein